MLALVWLTLVPMPRAGDSGEPISAWCLVCGDRGSADALLNVLFFVPLGVALANGRASAIGALAAGVALSAAVEVAQIAVPGRYPTLGDVVWNGLGALAGFAAVQLLVRHSRSPYRSAATVAAGGVGGALMIAGMLLQHSPTRAAYYGQWTADLGHMPPYDGRVLAATLDDLSLPDGRLDPSLDASLRLTADWTLRARIVKGALPAAVSPIVSIYDEEQAEILVLGAHGEDLVLRERTRAKAILFDHPDLRLAGALAGLAPGDTLTIGARRVGDTRCLSVGELERCGLSFTPGRTWGLLAFLEGAPEGGRRALDAAWMTALFFPVGLLSVSRRGLAVNGFLAGSGMAVAVLITRLSAPGAQEVVGACAGLALGWLAARLARRVLPGWYR